jgi:ABC-type glutathione transport system ATPase component
MNKPLLSVNALTIVLNDASQKKILDEVSFDIEPRSIVGIAGGSGSGKTTLGLSLLALISPAMRIVSGDVIFEEKSVLTLSQDTLRAMRGSRIGMVFQEPLSAFNPLYTIGYQIVEVMKAHQVFSGKKAESRAMELLSCCGVSDPKRIFSSYPHELSGGLRQRAMIAQALACGPSLLIADEPTSNLDVTVQAVILELFRSLREKMDLSVLFISHDLGVLRRVADKIVVLNEGRVVEQGTPSVLTDQARHPYTKALLQAEQI